MKNKEIYLLTKLFKIKGTKTTPLSVLETYGIGEFPYVTTQSTNNGVAGFYDFYTEEGNVLTVDSAVAGFCSYQEKNFSASDHVEKLIPLFPMDKYIGLYIATVINQNRYKFSYGRKASQKKLSELEIELPSINKETPDFDYMVSFMKKLHCKNITTKNVQKEIDINTSSWKEFKLGDILVPKYGINLELVNCTESKAKDAINFVARTAENNGVSSKVEYIEDKIPQKAGTITCAGGGSVLSTFVQDKDFYSGRDLYLLNTKENIPLGAKLFLCTIIEKNKYKYNYGRQANKTMKDIVLKLPIVCDSSKKPILDKSKKYSQEGYLPDFEYMNKYIKNLPYGDRI